ncbi:MAG: thioredoxin domain-containing protein [Phenylobacterium sp.]|uniref:thioredoxin domain-containing protein n=1 Tax=Phenylobacterium sp. TaxID=1871053 RepID=UPI0025CDB727|nr:thioredoxin domain-containing protein [Phenylobacterium sp.]MCA3738463.1 thioredoxin domain-containing protein [Phenylobacterium sp.]MCA6283535.1 thioredoxin domain-containing protein [Phenylobacterium sp.]
MRLITLLITMLLGLAATEARSAEAPVGPDRVMGRAGAPVLVEEFASLTCSSCGRFANDVFPAFKARYIDTGKVRFVVRPVLTPPQNVAAAGFMLARCAGPAGYYNVIKGIFRRQEEMFRSGDARAALLAAAAEGGISGAAVNACLADPAGQAALDADLAAAVSRGVESTPTFFFNGVKVKTGEMTLQEIDAAYTAALKARRKP